MREIAAPVKACSLLCALRPCGPRATPQFEIDLDPAHVGSPPVKAWYNSSLNSRARRGELWAKRHRHADGPFGRFPQFRPRLLWIPAERSS